jgi:DNA-binding transcriptional MerR regulator
MRIGELAGRAGVSTDTVRFYERSGWLPRATRRDNAYRDYAEADVEHLRLLIELRRLDVPLDDAARIAGWCHSGHCADASIELTGLIARRRNDVAERIAGLQSLDARLASLERHLVRPGRALAILDAQSALCCDAASAVVAGGTAGCACCSSAGAAEHRRDSTSEVAPPHPMTGPHSTESLSRADGRRAGAGHRTRP